MHDVSEMREGNPQATQAEALARCIEECFSCAQSCTSWADGCLGGSQVQEVVR